jgi:hypothetical protein
MDWTCDFKVKDQIFHYTTRTCWYSEEIILPFGSTCYVSVLTELVSLQTSQADVCKLYRTDSLSNPQWFCRNFYGNRG